MDPAKQWMQIRILTQFHLFFRSYAWTASNSPLSSFGVLHGLPTSVSDPDSLNPDPDPANLVNPDPDPDPGLKKLFKNKVLKIEFKWTFLN